MRLLVLLTLGLLVTGHVTNADAAAPAGSPTPQAQAPAKSTKGAKVSLAGVPKIRLKLSPAQVSDPSIRLGRMVQQGGYTMGDTVTLGPQRTVDGGAFVTAQGVNFVGADAPNATEAGFHVPKGGHVGMSLPRDWVGNHDLLVECTGKLPPKISTLTALVEEYGWSSYGENTIVTGDGRVRFTLMTADLADGLRVTLQLGNADRDDTTSWRLETCTVDRL